MNDPLAATVEQPTAATLPGSLPLQPSPAVEPPAGTLNPEPVVEGEGTSTDPEAVVDVEGDQPVTTPAATSPTASVEVPVARVAVASRKARRPAGSAQIKRYTLDLELEMHRGLRLYAVSHNVDAAKVMRALLWILMANQTLPEGTTLSDMVLDEMFDEEV